MWTFFTVVLVFIFLLIFPALSSLYDQEYNEQIKKQKQQEIENNEREVALSAMKVQLDDEARRLALQKVKIEERERLSHSYLSIQQLLIALTLFLIIAVMIILFFRYIALN